MSQVGITTEKDQRGATVLRLQGEIALGSVASLWEKTCSVLEEDRLEKVILDLREVTGIDTTGIAFVRRLENRCKKRNVAFSVQNVPDGIGQFLTYAEERATEIQEPEAATRADIISRVGQWALDKLWGIRRTIEFLGSVVLACINVALHPRKLRVNETLHHIQAVGADAVVLIGSLSGLMGMIMVFQGTLKIGNLGSNIFIADMVAISVTREMAPLLTAVLLAGRSGAAFAAEIGSMKLNQEIDSLEVMDFDIPEFLVLPRLAALLVAGPLLTLLANAAGILGGMITSHIFVGISFVSFLLEIQKSMGPADIYTGIIKGTAFAGIIGLTGCFCGLRTRTTANSVGIQTTTAVVASILLIVLADGLFAGVFQMFGW